MTHTLLSDEEFGKMYSRYLDGLNPYQLGEMYWQEFGFSSAESFRVSFVRRCKRWGLPTRDPAAVRHRSHRQQPDSPALKLSKEYREWLKNEVSIRKQQYIKRTTRLERQYQ